jgi:hypothetical protein
MKDIPAQVLYPSIFSALCRHSAEEAKRKPEIKNSPKANQGRNELLADLNPEQVKAIRQKIVGYWPEMRRK